MEKKYAPLGTSILLIQGYFCKWTFFIEFLKFIKLMVALASKYLKAFTVSIIKFPWNSRTFSVQRELSCSSIDLQRGRVIVIWCSSIIFKSWQVTSRSRRSWVSNQRNEQLTCKQQLYFCLLQRTLSPNTYTEEKYIHNN